MDNFLAGLSKHNIHAQDKDGNDTSHGSEGSFQEPVESSSGSMMLTPATEGFGGDALKDDKKGATSKLEDMEVHRLQKELTNAKQQLARQRQELDQNRVGKDTARRGVIFSEADQDHQGTPALQVGEQMTRGATLPGPVYGQVPWSPMSVAPSTASEVTSVGIGGSSFTAWPPSNRIGNHQTTGSGSSRVYQPPSLWNQHNTGPWNSRADGSALPPLMTPQQRTMSMPMSPGPATDGRFTANANAQYNGNTGLRRAHAQSYRTASYYPEGRNEWEGYTATAGPMDPMNVTMEANSMYQPMMMMQNPEPYQPRPIGTPLSPVSQDLRGGPGSANPWNAAVSRLWRLL